MSEKNRLVFNSEQEALANHPKPGDQRYRLYEFRPPGGGAPLYAWERNPIMGVGRAARRHGWTYKLVAQPPDHSELVRDFSELPEAEQIKALAKMLGGGSARSKDLLGKLAQQLGETKRRGQDTEPE